MEAEETQRESGTSEFGTRLLRPRTSGKCVCPEMSRVQAAAIRKEEERKGREEGREGG